MDRSRVCTAFGRGRSRHSLLLVHLRLQTLHQEADVFLADVDILLLHDVRELKHLRTDLLIAEQLHLLHEGGFCAGALDLGGDDDLDASKLGVHLFVRADLLNECRQSGSTGGLDVLLGEC